MEGMVEYGVGFLERIEMKVRLFIVCMPLYIRSHHTSMRTIWMRRAARMLAKRFAPPSGEPLPTLPKWLRRPTEEETAAAAEASGWENGRKDRLSWVG